MYLQFLKAGEGTGQLVGSLDLMTDFIQEDIGRTLDRWFFWITPLSLVLMGICFWILIEGAITPLYESIDHGMKDDWI
jgi:type II secretory pathway component PulF